MCHKDEFRCLHIYGKVNEAIRPPHIYTNNYDVHLHHIYELSAKYRPYAIKENKHIIKNIRGSNCLPFARTWVNSRFLVGTMLFIFVAFCVVLCFCVLFVFVLCLVYLMLSLDCPILIAPSVFSNAYI